MKNTRSLFLLLSVLAMSALSSCNMEFEDTKISSSGGTCEMIVVMTDKYWESGPGEEIRKLFSAPQPALPQDEPWMDIVHMNPAGFTELFQKHRNIVIVEFDPGLADVRTEARKDVWSQPQMVISIKAPNPESFAEELRRKGASLFKLVRQTEYARLEKAYKTAPARASENKVRKKFHIDLDIPLGFNVVVDEPGFLWMKRDAGKYDQGIFIYSRPYRNMNQLSYENIILLRDTMTRRYVPGPLEGGTHMAVELTFPPVSNDIHINGNFAVEMRGEWKVEGDMMGGPFVNYTVIDTLNEQVIWMDGYVYNPGGDKRDALIHVEGVFHTLRFGGEQVP